MSVAIAPLLGTGTTSRKVFREMFARLSTDGTIVACGQMHMFRMIARSEWLRTLSFGNSPRFGKRYFRLLAAVRYGMCLRSALTGSCCMSHVPLLSGYDEPRTLSYQITLFGPVSADVRRSIGIINMAHGSHAEPHYSLSLR